MSTAPKAVLTIDGKEYTLQYTRDAVRMLETTGMAPTTEGRDGTPMALTTAMFYAALRLHHKNVNQTQAQALLDEVLDAGISFEDIASLLMELYQAVFSPPVAQEDDGKTATIQRFGIKDQTE